MNKLIPIVILLLFHECCFSQSVGIGTSSPDPSAQLDVFSNTKGLLPPRIALVSLIIPDPITNPATGLIVYNTSTSGLLPNNVTPGYYFWTGTVWAKLSQDNSPITLNNVVIKNYSEAVPQNVLRTFVVPAGKIWKINFWTYPGKINFGDV